MSSLDVRSAPETTPTATPPEPHGRPRRTAPGLERRHRGYRVGVGLAGLGAVLLAWQLAALALHDATLLPTVGATVSDFVKYVHESYPAASVTLVGHALISLRRIAFGFILGTTAGLVIGSTMAAFRPVRFALDPILTVIRPVPPLAFIPLFIVWLGVDETAKIGLIILGVVTVVATATLAALDSVPVTLVQASRSLGAGTLRTLLLVRSRAALPALITGMRLALGGAWSSIIAAELVGATEGIGFVTLQAGNYLQTTLVLSGIVIIAVLGLATDGLLRIGLRFADPSLR